MQKLVKVKTKNRVLRLLESKRGENLSGQEIADSLNITRSSVWKAISSLKEIGYIIKGVNNLGYIFSEENEILSSEGISCYLQDDSIYRDIFVFDKLESTNKTAKEMAVNGAKHQTTIIANCQTAGRGRFSRTFHSPPQSGLYMSIILRPEFTKLKNITMVTAAVAVAVCDAIKNILGVNVGIKWVNDIVLNHKKACGILTEAITSFENGGIEWVITGIGVNVYEQNFPEEYENTATSISNQKSGGNLRNKLAADIITRLLINTDWMTEEIIYNKYREKLVIMNENITVYQGEESYEALVVGLEKDCRLVVKKESGEIIKLNSGEVSTKWGF